MSRLLVSSPIDLQRENVLPRLQRIRFYRKEIDPYGGAIGEDTPSCVSYARGKTRERTTNEIRAQRDQRLFVRKVSRPTLENWLKATLLRSITNAYQRHKCRKRFVRRDLSRRRRRKDTEEGFIKLKKTKNAREPRYRRKREEGEEGKARKKKSGQRV